MKTAPFFSHHQHATGVMAPAPVSKRGPFHDNSDCPVGQEVKRSGEWQYYASTQLSEMRPRCTHCIELSRG